MKIIFICGSAEPGKDGVGDYTRRLAAALIQHGYFVSIIALYDKSINSNKVENQYVDDQFVAVLRLCYHMSHKERLERAKDYIDSINPDWLSLQYVPFSFQKKGLAIRLGNDLNKICGARKWHIMLHELWCGMNIKAPLKERILGYLQRKALKIIIQDLKPVSIFTSLLSYQKYLIDININPLVVPIFGNIRVNQNFSDPQYVDFLRDLEIDEIDSSSMHIKIGFFGTIYQLDGIEELIMNFLKYAEIQNKKLVLLIIGDGRGPDIKTILNSKNIIYVKTGRLSEFLLDNVLKLVDVGIMTSTSDGLDKSGSAIAFLERAIPVVVAGTDKSYKESMKLNGLYQIKQIEDAAFVIEKGKLFAPMNRLENAVSRYVNCFKN